MARLRQNHLMSLLWFVSLLALEQKVVVLCVSLVDIQPKTHLEQTPREVGWVTVKGNAGTTYASASKTHYAIVKEAHPGEQKRGVAYLRPITGILQESYSNNTKTPKQFICGWSWFQCHPASRMGNTERTKPFLN